MTTAVAAPGDLAGSSAVPALQAAGGGTFVRLLRFALAGVRRRPERFVLSVLGIALAMTAVIVVRTISIGYSAAGTTALNLAMGDSPLWVVPAAGTTYDPQLRALIPDGAAPALTIPDGWTKTQTVGGVWTSPEGRIALYGRDGIAAGTAVVGSQAAERLHVGNGSTLTVGGHRLAVTVTTGGVTVMTSMPVARAIVGRDGWWTVDPSGADAARTDLGALLSRASGMAATTDPATTPDVSSTGLIYDARGETRSPLSFAQRWAGQFAGKVTSSTLGLVSIVGLVLGFIIAVSSFLAAVTERRREFGIMSSIGLADEILYFFLVESALVYVVAYAGGALLAGAAVAIVVPGLVSVSAWLQAAGLVAGYLPVMAIVGALVPVHRLLQQRPVALLAET